MCVLKVRLARDIGGLYERVNRMMDDVLNLHRPMVSQGGGGWIPEADVFETRDLLVVCVNLAGVRREDIEIAYDENYLRVEGKRFPGFHERSGSRYHRLEMGFGPFERVFRVPVGIDPDRIEATLKDGMLWVRMGKRRAGSPTESGESSGMEPPRDKESKA